MPDCSVIAFAAAVLERDDFLVLSLFKDFAGDSGTLDQRAAMDHVVVIAVEKHVSEDAFLSSFFIEEVDIDNIAFGDAMLSASSSDNCESHGREKVAQGHMGRAF